MMVAYTLRILLTYYVLSLLSTVAHASTLAASQDTYSNGIVPGAVNGATGEIRARSYGPSNGFIQFDLSAIAGNTVDSATLAIDVIQVKKAGSIDVMVVSQSWSEDSLTYLNQPSLGSTVASLPISSSDQGNSVTVDIGSLAQQWADGSTANFGIALVSSSINVKLGTKEGGSAATLNIVTSTGGPTKTHVTVPGDFSTIQQAINSLRASWCPANAQQCSVIVGPGYFDGFVCCDEEDVTLAIIGEGKNATIVTGETIIDKSDGVELRHLTIDSDLWIIDNSGANNPIKLIDIAIIGDGVLFQDATNVDEGSIVKLFGVDATVLYVSLSSGVDVSKSDIESLKCEESTISSRFSYLGIIDSFNCELEILSSVVNSIEFDADSLSKTLKILHSDVKGGIDIENATGRFGNSRISGDITKLFGSTLKCTNVLDQNLDPIEPDCAVTP